MSFERSEPAHREGEPRLVLASASPRRSEILGCLGLSFRVVPADIDEQQQSQELPEAYVRRMAREKGAVVAERVVDERPAPFVLSADTIVTVDGDVLGKPVNHDDAIAMIRRLRGRWHEVATAVAVHRPGEGLVGEELSTASVRFRALSDETVARYVATGEGVGKAGGYAVQGVGAGIVAAIEGSYHTVVGLPGAETVLLLQRCGALGEWP